MNSKTYGSISFAVIIILVSAISLSAGNVLKLTKVNGETVQTMQLETEIPELLKKAAIPGLSLAVINNGKLVYTNVFGVKRIDTNEKVQIDTVFEAASLTKPVLAYIALQLVDEGKLELDKPLYQYFEYKDIAHDERHKLITARLVLMHSTGFPNWRSNRKKKKLDIKFKPGKKFSYSGEGYVYLQKVIEKITGIDLEGLAITRVFKPLGMTHSSLLLNEAQANTTAQGHRGNSKMIKKRLEKRPNGAASLHTTALDYARFMAAVLKGNGLSKQIHQQMLKPQIPYSKTNKSLSWGLGFGLQTSNSPKDTVFWHWGDNGVFKAFAMVSRATGTGVVYFANSTNGLSVMEKLVDMTMGGSYGMFFELEYGQYDGPAAVLGKLIETKGLETGLKKYAEWKAREPRRFSEKVLNTIGYYLLNAKKLDEAIEIFKLNVEAYPKSYNVYDCLGEAYMKKGDKLPAIKNYEKSVQLNPENTNGINALKKLKE